MHNWLNTDRNPRYLAFVRSKRCWFCGKDAEPHHPIKHWFPISNGGIGRKGSDYLAIPLCREHHRKVHDGLLKIDRVELFEIIVTQLVTFIAQHGAIGTKE